MIHNSECTRGDRQFAREVFEVALDNFEFAFDEFVRFVTEKPDKERETDERNY